MSIQKSLRLSLVLMACLPLIFLTIFTYNLSYKKYMDLATQSTVELAKNYGMGFQSQLIILRMLQVIMQTICFRWKRLIMPATT